MAAYDILTAAEAKAYMGVSGSDKDTIIGTFISDASLWIEGFLGRKVAGSQTVTNEIGHGNGTEIFYPKFPPVSAVTTFQYRASPTGSYSDVVTDSSNIIIDPIEGDFIEVYGTVVPAGRSNIKLTYTAGYSTVPNEIKQVCYEMVAHRFKDSNDTALGDDRLGRGSKTISQAGVNHSKTYIDMEKKWKAALKPFRTKRVVKRGSSIVQMGR